MLLGPFKEGLSTKKYVIASSLVILHLTNVLRQEIKPSTAIGLSVQSDLLKVLIIS